ncbi:diphthine synthase [Holotrichia oblita]|uniref:Diphthine synthase n=1 Tax=Holotrichia oblita TaxID=644536 RepID=A0ACB9TP96_HOLOL|nr:diphthine synthase [Holotrichia oblita]
MFFLIGLGLGDPKDITVKGLEIIKKCSRVYLEAYTSILSCGTEALEEFYGRNLIVADRDLAEQGADEILEGAHELDIALLVVGDPFGATTHTDLVLRAKEKGIKVQVVHNASILNAVGCCGLQLYMFGETVSIPYWTDTWQPDSFFNKIVANYEHKLHTLCLLDIKVKEPTPESLTRKKKEYMPPKFMSVQEAAQQLLNIIQKHPKTCKNYFFL